MISHPMQRCELLVRCLGPFGRNSDAYHEQSVGKRLRVWLCGDSQAILRACKLLLYEISHATRRYGRSCNAEYNAGILWVLL
jgi:hypothetical protein